MKSVNFQRNKSLIRVVNERKDKKQRNWDRILYLVLLAFFVLFMLYYFFAKFVYVHAFGHVIIENTHIRLTDDSRIIEFYIHEGDSIQKTTHCFHMHWIGMMILTVNRLNFQLAEPAKMSGG